MGMTLSPRPARVIDLETMRQKLQAKRRLVRLSPELDGLEMVYSLASDPDSLYGMPILAWGLREDGDVVGLVPWMETLTSCHQLDDAEHGRFVGYRDPETEELLEYPPPHKACELEHAAAYFDYEETRDITLIQQIPDTQGTHALCIDDDDRPWQLKQVFGWRLYSDGWPMSRSSNRRRSCPATPASIRAEAVTGWSTSSSVASPIESVSRTPAPWKPWR